MRILFMGTPDIARSCLKSLIDGGCNVVAVVTGEDKPRGRGKHLTPTPVKALAEESGIPTYTPKTLRDGSFYETLREIDPELIAVVAYGKILPKEVIDYPKYGCMNVHVSLLPKYRGAAPMQRAIMNGESETGVTIMYMDEGLDTGDIISAEKFPISPEDDFESVHDKSAEIGGRMLVSAIFGAEAGTLTRTKQNDAEATYAKKIEREEARLDLSLPAEKLDHIIRGLTPIPGAFVMNGGKMLKIAKATPESSRPDARVGEVIAADAVGEGSITVAVGEGALKITALIPEGKGKMTAGDYLRGRKIAVGDILE